jgi:hypothetical protein
MARVEVALQDQRETLHVPAEANLGSIDPHQDGDLLPKSGGLTSRPRGAWVELKTINGCGPYAYLRWRENGRQKSKYLGKVEEARALPQGAGKNHSIDAVDGT